MADVLEEVKELETEVNANLGYSDYQHRRHTLYFNMKRYHAFLYCCGELL